MAVFKAGKGGRAQVTGINMAMQNWTANVTADELDCSNFEGNGKKSWLIGLQWLDWSIGTLWDSAQVPLTDPPGLYVRDDGTAMNLYANVSLSKFFSLPNWVCSKSNMGVEVAGLVKFDAAGKAQEDFVLLT